MIGGPTSAPPAQNYYMVFLELRLVLTYILYHSNQSSNIGPFCYRKMDW